MPPRWVSGIFRVVKNRHPCNFAIHRSVIITPRCAFAPCILIAMAFAVLGVVTGGVVIEGAECVTKTFPDFWSILESTGAKLKYNE